MYTFTMQPITIEKRTKFHSWLITFRDRRALLTQFRNDLHIKRLESENIDYKLPKTYLITTNETTRFYHIRNKIINLFHKKYAEKQKAIDAEIKELEKEHQELKDGRTNERKELDSLQRKLKNIKSSDDYIAMEARIAKAEAKLNNTDAGIKSCEQQIRNLFSTKEINLTDWNKQVKNIEEAIEMAINDYIKRATSKIESRYGFMNFTHTIDKYDESMIKIVKGEY